MTKDPPDLPEEVHADREPELTASQNSIQQFTEEQKINLVNQEDEISYKSDKDAPIYSTNSLVRQEESRLDNSENFKQTQSEQEPEPRQSTEEKQFIGNSQVRKEFIEA